MSKNNLTVSSRSVGNSGASYHKGWQVRGIPPTACQAEQSDTRAAKRKERRAVVGTFSSRAAAQDCFELASRDGWFELEVVEAKSEGPLEDSLWSGLSQVP